MVADNSLLDCAGGEPGDSAGKIQLYIGIGQGGDHGNGKKNYKKPENAAAMSPR